MREGSSTSKSTERELPTRPVRQYMKMTKMVKNQLLELIIRDNFTIRKASEKMKINYSSAKIILNKYRVANRESFKTELVAEREALVRDIGVGEWHRPGVVCLVGGRYETQSFGVKNLVELSVE